MSMNEDLANQQEATKTNKAAPMGKYEFAIVNVMDEYKGEKLVTEKGKQYYKVALMVTSLKNGESYKIYDAIFDSGKIAKILESTNPLWSNARKATLDDLYASIGDEGICFVGQKEYKGETQNTIECYIKKKGGHAGFENPKQLNQQKEEETEEDDDVPF